MRTKHQIGGQFTFWEPGIARYRVVWYTLKKEGSVRMAGARRGHASNSGKSPKVEQQ
jgi:hypothetical protein